VPAVTLAVDGPGRSRFVTASGTEERDGDTPATADAQFRVASTTKLFVSTVVLQLVEEGRLRLDDPVSAYVPGFDHAHGVTIRQLLNHTSGIPDYTRTDHFHEGLLADRDRVWSTDEMFALVADVRRDFAPGNDYLYSNTGYLLLGRVIDTVTGSTWAAEVRRRILDPLRLPHTYIAGAEPVPGGVVPGYIDADMDGDVENVETGRPWPALETAEGPAGAIVSTAGDLAAFADALFRGRLLSPSTLKQMVAEGPHHPRNANYGLGVEITRPDYRLTVWGHGGYTIGFKSALWYVPKQDLVVVVLANDARANTSDLAELVVRTELADRGH
ncbi:MAG TPA: serine hydrolase domain-containing protein, partial [Candidatus Binatia bacterium]|nr:serine hydrolase domain-containing protein [Candidatus Binatia bacterium]